MSAMSWFTHVRRRFWDAERYTEAQAHELRQLRALYTTHLVPVFGPTLPDTFRLRTEGNDYYPAYTSTRLLPLPAMPVPSAIPPSAQPFKSFADTLLVTLAVYEERRAQRRYGKGHPNDPTRLLGIYLRNLFENWLTHAAYSATTLQQVIALRQFLEAIQSSMVFTQEGQDHGSMTVLLHNLVKPLTFLEKRLQHDLQLQSAREHFAELKEKMAQLLSESAHYLFYALAAKDRTHLPFSLLNAQAHVVDKQLKASLASREGLLLQQWIHAPSIGQALLPQQDEKNRGTKGPVSLLGTDTSTPLLDEKGQAHPIWQAFLQQDAALEEQCDPAFKPLSIGICPLLLADAKTLSKAPSAESSLLAECIRLHGFMGIVAQYQTYLQHCWQLAGFGGDYWMYDQIAEAVVSILSELQLFQEALAQQFIHFQEHLAMYYQQALEDSLHPEWRKNYGKAKVRYEQLQVQLKACQMSLQQVLQHAKDTAARGQRKQMAAEAYRHLAGASVFLQQVRQQLGLAPKENYPGLQPPADPKTAPSSENRFGSSLDQKEVSLEQVIVTLLSEPQQAAELSTLCATTPTTRPWPLWRGSYQRYCYLQAPERLHRMGSGLMQLQLGAQAPMTPEKKALITQLQTALQEEQTRIRRLRQRLWWPFHRASLRFFDAWQAGLTRALQSLSSFSQSSASPMPSTAVASRSLASLLTPASPVLEQSIVRDTKTLIAPQSVSSETQKKIADIYPRCSKLTLRHRACFDTWQQSRFGKLLWDAHGSLQVALTESDGTAILEEWERLAFQCADEMIAAYRIEEQRAQYQIRSRYASSMS